MGPLAPAAMPTDVQRVYSILSENFDGSYNVVWPQAYGFAYSWSTRVTPWYPPGSGPPAQFYSYFSEIAKRGEAYLVKPLMDTYGVRYIVVDNTSYTGVSPLAVGMTNAQVARFLEESPGIVLAINDSPYLLVFEDPGASTVQGYSVALSPEGGVSPLSVLYYFSALLEEEPLLINGSSGIPLPVNEARIGNSPYALYTNGYFSAIHTAPQPPKNYFNYSPSAGIYALSDQWYFESIRGSGTLYIEGGQIVLSSSAGSLASLSYGDFLSPGHTAIPIPDGCGVDVNISYYFNGSAGSSVSTSVWVNDANYTKHGGWQIASNEMMGKGKPERVTLGAVIPPGQAYFEVQINPEFKGSVQVWGVNINYSFFRIEDGYPVGIPALYTFRVVSSSTLERTISWTGGGRELAILYAGNGTLTVNGVTYRLDSGRGVGELRLYVEGDGANLSNSGLSIGGMIVAERNATPGPVDLFSGFNPLTGTLTLRPAPGITYLVLATPAYGWKIQEGRYLGFDEMGREAFLISPESHLYVRDALLVNALEYAFTVAFYSVLVLVFAPIRIKGRRTRDHSSGIDSSRLKASTANLIWCPDP